MVFLQFRQFRFARTNLDAGCSTITFLSCIFTVDVLLKAVGDTPIMKTKKWAVDRGRTVQSLSQFISRFLKLDASEQLVRMKFVNLLFHLPKHGQVCRKHTSDLSSVKLYLYLLFIYLTVSFIFVFVFIPQFIYVNQSFAPSPDQDVGILFDVSIHKYLELLVNAMCHIFIALFS